MTSNDFKVVAKTLRSMRDQLSIDDFLFVLDSFCRVFTTSFPDFDIVRFQNFILKR
jgi:hypothetical protein